MKIVAPAGNMERFYSAINAGADEIYMGLKGYGARRNADNFTLEEIKFAIDYAHERGSRIFLTLNTIMKNVEIDYLYHNFKELYKHGLDAVIIQDLGYFRFLKENFPNIDYHGSTQMTVANHIEANYLKNLGFKRVVLPREMTFEEIKEIKEKTDIELEVFVSGALCICYSGNCYMSSFIGGRSGNRGMCAQPCRKMYQSENSSGYLLSPKDQLLGRDEIEKLKSIGIESIKIEGRMKEVNYVYEAVQYFKGILDNNFREEKLSSIFNRGYSTGYLLNKNKKEDLMNKYFSSSIGKRIGIVSGKEVVLEEEIVLGDGVSYLSRDYSKIGGEYINRIQKKNSDEKFKVANKGDKIILKNIPKGARYLYKNYDKKINDEIEFLIKKSVKTKEIKFEFIGKLGEYPVLKVDCLNNYNQIIKMEIKGDNIISKAEKKAVKSETIEEKLLELGDTNFVAISVKVNIDDEIFLPISQIKSMRRDLIEKFKIKLIESHRRLHSSSKFNLEIEEDISKHAEISVVVSTEEQNSLVKELGIKKIYKRGVDIAKESKLDFIDLNSNLATNLYQVLNNKTDDITVGWNLNIANIYSIEEISKLKNVKTIILSPELSYEQIEKIGKVSVRKAMLGYSKLKAMYIECPLFENNERIKNEANDVFISKINKNGNNEIYFEKPLNVLSQVKRLGKIGIDEVVIEFLDETEEEIRFIFNNINKKENEYSPFNYERGVF